MAGADGIVYIKGESPKGSYWATNTDCWLGMVVKLKEGSSFCCLTG